MFKENSEINILFLGPKGTYTDIAKDKFVEKYNLKNIIETPKSTILSVLHELDERNDRNLFAVIPIENSIEGVVRETLDNLTRIKNENIRILAETAIPIEHCLISRASSFDEIEVVSSYTQGIAQCRSFIENNFSSEVKINTVGSTSQAVKDLLTLDSTHAAIGSEKAAKLYELPVLTHAVNDEKDNKTRFVLIGHGDTKRTGHDKTSITFTTDNKPGALFEVLNIINNFKLNMTYIDSRPSKKFLGEYTFYIDVDGHIKDEVVAKAMFQILQHTKQFKHLGSYESF